MKDLKGIAEAIKKYKTFAIMGHFPLDADSLTSCAVMKIALCSLGYTAHCFTGKIKHRYDILEFEGDNTEDMLESYDCAIVLDISGTRRLNNVEGVFERCKDIVCIDHHLQVDFDIENIFVDSSRSSNVEIVYELIKLLGVEITDKIAKLVYAGMAEDTNCFMYSSVNQKTLAVFSEILDYNLDRQNINYVFFEKYKSLDLKGIRYFAKHKKIFCDGKACYIYLPKRIAKKYKVSSDYIGKFARYIDDVKIGIVIRKKERNVYTASLRSLGEFSVNNIATKFGGGGHKNASGLMYKGALGKLLKTLRQECKVELEKINQNNGDAPQKAGKK